MTKTFSCYSYVVLTVLSINLMSTYAAEIIKGDAALEQSFTFPIAHHAFYIPSGKFYVGAAQSVEGNAYAVAAASRASTTFTPLTPARVTLNNVTNQANPLQGISLYHLALMAHKALIVAQEEPNRVYAIDDMLRPGTVEVFSTDNLADAHGVTTPRIIGLTSTLPHLLEEPENILQEMAAFAAVTNQAGSFDGNGSGIALLYLTPTKEGEKTIFNWNMLDAQTGQNNGNRAVPLGIDTPQLKIQNDLSSIASVVDMHFDSDLKRLYIALQVQAGPHANDGAFALLSAGVVNGKLVFVPIAPSSAITANNKIIAGVGAHAQIKLHKVRTMYTKTHVRYVIVVGGNVDGSLDDTRQRVYALPLIDNLESAAHGTLANVNVTPFDLFSDGDPIRFQARMFLAPAQNPTDLYDTTSPAAQIGGSSKLPGPITDICIIGDAVFVSVAQEGNNQQAGLFYSQALFDYTGRIVGWTQWQRAGGSTHSLSGFALDPLIGTFWFLPTGDSITTHAVLRTLWNSEKGALGSIVSQAFPQNRGGVQGIFDFPIITDSFSTHPGSRLSLLALTGFKKIMLVQTGKDSNGNFGLNADIGQSQYNSSNGTLSHFEPGISQLSIAGGALDIIGPINAAEVVSDGNSGWLAVGGSRGLAILANPNGTGWNAQEGLSSGFVGLNEQMSFKLVGPYRNIRKLMSSGNILYVLTQSHLYKLIVTADGIARNALASFTLAHAQNDVLRSIGSFSDMLITGPLALLATSNGLLRSGNGVDIAMTTNAQDVQWTSVLLPESAGSFTDKGPVTRLYPISPTGLAKDTLYLGSVYVLNAYVGYHQAQVYRLALNGTQGVVSDTTVLLYPDFFIKDKRTFFVNLGDYRNYVTTDGSLITASRSGYGDNAPFIDFLPPRLKSGQRFGARNSLRFTLQPGRSVGRLIRNSASGSWLLSGDFGLKINE